MIFHENRRLLMKYHTLFFSKTRKDVTKILSSAAVVIGALRVNHQLKQVDIFFFFNSLHASGISFRLLITFANCLEPDQERQNVAPDLGPNCDFLIVFLKEFIEKVNFENRQQTTTEA